MATDNKQKVLIRSMSVEELENYLVNSDLNGKITPKNEDTWHQNYDDNHTNIQPLVFGSILANNSKSITFADFSNRIIWLSKFLKSINFDKSKINYYASLYSTNIYAVHYFRPLIEYKE